MVRQNELLDSVVYFGRAIELDDREGTYYLHRAETYESLGFVDMAMKDYRSFKRCTLSWIDVFEDKIQALLKVGNTDEAKTFKNFMIKIA